LPVENVDRRYAHFLALRSLADAPRLRERLVVQGSTVAAYMFDSGRAPRDIDLLLRGRHNDSITEDERQSLIQETSLALSAGTRKFCPDFGHWREKLQQHIRVEFFGPLSPFTEIPFAVDPATTTATLMVLDLASLLATKFHALFRSRLVRKSSSYRQDIFDIASLVTRNRVPIDPNVLFRRLGDDPRPSWTRDMSTEDLFDSELKRQAEHNYGVLEELTGDHFIEFPIAWDVAREYYSRARAQVEI
jgi:hypothetical protein